MPKITISTGDKESVVLGGLVFEVLQRTIDDDGGYSIEVYGEADRETQVLRFDCFRKDPHYHMPPSAPGQLGLDAGEVGNGVEWALEQVRENLPEMISKAGFEALASDLDADLFRTSWELIRDAVDRAPEPSHTAVYDLPSE